MLLRIDTPGEHDLGRIEAGECRAKDCVVEVTAPDVELCLDGFAMTGREGDPNGDNDWPVFVRIAPSAVRCQLVHSRLTDLDGIGVDVKAPDFRMAHSEVTHMASGVRINSTVRSVVEDCALHRCDRMLRVGSGSNDDTGASAYMSVNTPFHDKPNVVRRSYIGECRAPSPDYGEDGSAWEVWQAQSALFEDCVLLDCNNTLETGSKGPQCGNLFVRRCLIGVLKPDGSHPGRGLMWRPVIDSIVEDCRFFDLDHWNLALNQGSANYAAGVTKNFLIRRNQHACTRNSKAYSGATTGITIEAATETVLYGAAATELAKQFRAEAIAARDAILAGAGIVAPIVPPDAELEARVAALEAQMTTTTATADEALRLATGLAGDVETLDRRLDEIGEAAAD